MKKIIYILAAGAAAASIAGCAGKTTTAATEAVTSIANTAEEVTEIKTANESGVENEAVLAGGWVKASSPKIDDEVKEYFSEAFPDGTDTFYEPVALLGTQVVAGTNYRVLCRKISIGTEDAIDTYVIATFYVDLQNKAEALDMEETKVPTHFNEGGWTIYEVTDLTDDEKNAFLNAFDGMTGVSYNPIAIVAESDTGYLVLCDASVVYPGAEEYYTVVEIKKTETGNLEIGEISDQIASTKDTE